MRQRRQRSFPSSGDEGRPPTRSERRQSKAQKSRPSPESPAGESPGSLKRLPAVAPMNGTQEALLVALHRRRVVLATGPAGTGKTYVMLAHALDLFAAGEVDHVVCLRPTVEAGGSLGFLPGGMADKLDPYFAPIRQNICKRLGSHAFGNRWMKSAQDAGSLVFTSIQHLRGQTLERAFVLTDEAQNCTYAELKLILTRMGQGSRMAFAGDPEQSDLPEGASGWPEFVGRLAPLEALVGVGRFGPEDVVRDPLLAKLLPHL